MTDRPTPQANPAPETIVIQDLDQFVKILTAWHAERVALVNKLLEIPAGTAFEIGDASLTLSDDALPYFKFGVEMALMQLDTLPFAAELEPTTEPVNG